MVHIHITVQESGRFPGKNDLLWEYTRVWLANELMELEEPYEVIVTVRGAGLDARKVPGAWNVLVVEGVPYTHEGDLRTACRTAGRVGAHVLLQLTQPLRRRGLLADALQALRGHRDATVMSACGGQMAGALYAWYGDPRCVFARENPYYVDNIGHKVDIDRPSDVPPDLDIQWQKLLLKVC